MTTPANPIELIAGLSPTYTAQIVAEIIKTGITPELVKRAGNVPDEIYDDVRF